jgi:Uma2 family endonuclease
MAEYMANGACLGWLVDPLTHTVYVYRPGRDVEQLDAPETLSGDPVLIDFTLRLDEIW